MKRKTTFCGVTLKNPLIAGSCDNSRSLEQSKKIIQSGIGGIVLKSLTDVVPLQNRRIARFLSLNTESTPWQPGDAKGGFFSRGGSMLSQKDWEQNLREIRPLAADHDVVLIGNICAAYLQNWKTYACIVEDSGMPLIELNLGNPHYGSIEEPMGARISQMEELLYNIIDSVSQVVSIPVIAKLSPQVSDIVRLAETCKDAGAAAVTISHRFQGFMVDIDSGRPFSRHLYGYGGPWLVPITLGYVYKIATSLDIPICGSGGISRWEDIVQFLATGASTVQITSALMLEGPSMVDTCLDGISSYCEQHSYSSFQDIVGSALTSDGIYDSFADDSTIIVANPDSCRRCDDRPCINACFFDALHWRGNALVVSDTCTSCGLCIQYCPFEGTLKRTE